MADFPRGSCTQQDGGVVDQRQTFQVAEQRAQARFGRQNGVALDQSRRPCAAEPLAFAGVVLVHVGGAVGKQVQRARAEMHAMFAVFGFGEDAERRAVGRDFLERLAVVQQRGRKSGARQHDLARRAIVDADGGADEAAVLQRAAQFGIHVGQPFRWFWRVTARAAQHAGHAHHQERGVEALAGHVGDDEARCGRRAAEIIVEIAGNLVGRKIHADDRKRITTRFRQQRFLHLPREREFALDALLLDQAFGELRAVDGERGRCGDETQDVGVVFVEQAAVAAIDDFQCADRALRGAQRRAQDRFA